MKDTKRRIELYSFFDHSGIEKHLEKMAKKGWILQKITNLFWVYRRANPQNLKFSVSYCPSASEFDPSDSETKNEYNEFCRHTGWNYAASGAQMFIFYTELENPTPIQTEPSLEVEAIHRSVKKTIIPIYFILMLLAVLQGAMFVTNLISDPIDILSNSTSLFTGFGWTMLFILFAAELSGYYLWRHKAKKAAEQGEFPESHGHKTLYCVTLLAVFIGFIYWIISLIINSSYFELTIAVIMLFAVAALIFLVNGVKQFLKNKNTPAKVNMTLTVVSSFVLSFLLIGVVTFGIITAAKNGIFDRESQFYQSLYLDSPPLTVEDLLGNEELSDRYITQISGGKAVLLGKYEIRQYARSGDSDARLPGLEYTVTVVKARFMYDFCKNHLIKNKDETEGGKVIFADHYEKTDASEWGANEAYRRYRSANYVNQYILCYDNYIVEIKFDWEPTASQKSIVGDIFS